ncbi:hypothetical protein C8F04DRAFT_1178254 [Mycena alexandri]|uniref:Uncharacterized protein n=1 Tax=Mycena alexandri TaxID=1745969 RepID=A0AAD6T998_9AGAR|nr:hypothetical protein C8F04DRAFT_1178254 [Mycena alexandri]
MVPDIEVDRSNGAQGSSYQSLRRSIRPSKPSDIQARERLNKVRDGRKRQMWKQTNRFVGRVRHREVTACCGELSKHQRTTKDKKALRGICWVLYSDISAGKSMVHLAESGVMVKDEGNERPKGPITSHAKTNAALSSCPP